MFRPTTFNHMWRLGLFCALILITTLVVTACDHAPAKADDECDPGELGHELTSPDGLHIARLHEALCGAPGSTDIWIVTVRRASAPLKSEITVFSMVNDPPRLRWLDSMSLSIFISDIDPIGTSEENADGVHIVYKVKQNISIERLSSLQKTELDWVEKERRAYADVLMPQIYKKYFDFEKWLLSHRTSSSYDP